MAITARYIMNNDLSRCLPGGAGRQPPYLIWYPDAAVASTYAALARACPHMRPIVCRAAIYCDYQELFDDLMTLARGDDAVRPTRALLIEAQSSPNPHYRGVIERRAGEAGVSLDAAAMTDEERLLPWLLKSARSLRNGNRIWTEGVTLGSIYTWFQQSNSIYNGSFCDASYLNLSITIPDAWKPTREAVEDVQVAVDYDSWPPQAKQ
jgi:hypothetical protein